MFTVVAVVRLLWQAERDPSVRALLDPLMDHREGKEDDEERKSKGEQAHADTLT